MNIIQSEDCAFIFPDDMDAFRKKFKVEVIYVDLVDGSIQGFGEDDKDWKELPADAVVRTVTKLRSTD